jgi:hypothetical protein
MALKRRPAVTPAIILGGEVERWFQEPCIPVNSTPEEIKAYILGKRVTFPIITQMARDFQAIPATSAPSERQFSYAGNLISKKRTSITSENVRYVLCLRSWGFLPDSDDEVEMIFNDNGVHIEVEDLATIGGMG